MNEVEKAEPQHNSQLARQIEFALQRELTQAQNIQLAQEYASRFVEKGMAASLSIHDKGDGNPHAHIMLTMRPFNPDGTCGEKSRKEYILDENGDRIRLPSGQWKSRRVNTTDWDNRDNVEIWREQYAELTNRYLERYGHEARIDHRSYERQGIERIPTIHLGHYAHRLEQQGIESDRGNINRQIEQANQKIQEIKERVESLDTLAKQERQRPEASTPPTHQERALNQQEIEKQSTEAQERSQPEPASTYHNRLLIIPRMLSFTGAWLLVFSLVYASIYFELQYDILDNYGLNYLVIIPIIASCVPIAITWRKGLEASISLDSWFPWLFILSNNLWIIIANYLANDTYGYYYTNILITILCAFIIVKTRGIKACKDSWVLHFLILYSIIPYIAYGVILDMNDRQALIFISFWYAVVITIRNTIRIIRKPARLNKLFEAARGVSFGTVPCGRKEMPITRDIDDDGHVLVVGGAGSGKSSCIAIPTLKKYWDGRFLAVDIKGELAEKSGRNALIFNPTDPNAYGYDPFYLVRTVDNPAAYIRDIALTIAPTPPNVKDLFWVQAAQNILTGHLLYSYQDGATFFESIEIIQSVKPHSLLEVDATNPQALMYISQFLDAEPKTLAGIMSELSNHIIPYIADPDIKTALTAKNTITPELLEHGHDIFLQIPEHKITLWKSMIALIIQQFLTHFQCRPEGDGIPPILFLLDEFARLEKIDGILHGLATLRSKKICICILTQSLAQLDATYGTEQRKIIADNCAYKAILKATDADTQKYLSALVGT